MRDPVAQSPPHETTAPSAPNAAHARPAGPANPTNALDQNDARAPNASPSTSVPAARWMIGHWWSLSQETSTVPW